MIEYKLNEYDPEVFFLGSDEEIAAAEKLQDENDNLIVEIARKIKAVTFLYAYYDVNYNNGYTSRFVLHNSAKYHNQLQLTTLTYIKGKFAFASYDCRITDKSKLLSEFMPGHVVFCE